jgi:hypothetical protein
MFKIIIIILLSFEIISATSLHSLLSKNELIFSNSQEKTSTNSSKQDEKLSPFKDNAINDLMQLKKTINEFELPIREKNLIDSSIKRAFKQLKMHNVIVSRSRFG